jgi:hypothetical protein
MKLSLCFRPIKLSSIKLKLPQSPLRFNQRRNKETTKKTKNINEKITKKMAKLQKP